jgi:Zn-dependent M16 (insulinase) family peptidase
MIVNVTLDEKNWVKFRLGLDEFLLGLPNRQPNYPQWNISGTPRPEGLVVPAQVNYVGKAADLYRLGYELHGSINVINKYLRTTWLWEKIRVQGGAYGGMCGFNHHSGIYTLSSYRDPNLFESLQIFDETAAFLRQGELHKEEIIKSIIGAIGDLDAYLLPDAKGYSSMVRFLVKEDDQGRQQFRDEVIGTSVQDFRRFANILDGIRASQAVAVMGAREALEEANRRHEDYFQLAQVL